VPGSLARIQGLAESWTSADDHRAIFAAAYGTMTVAMLDAIDRGEFADGAWVGDLLDRFADYYFVAVEGHEAAAGGCPTVWQEAFDACRSGGLHPLQHLFLGINAHINYDLAFSLADVLADWHDLDDGARAGRLADHSTVNRVIEQTVDVVQDEVIAPISPVMATIDRALWRVDEWAFSRLITGWRGAVWDDAVRLLEADDEARPLVVAAIEERSLGMARRVGRIRLGRA